MMLASKGYGHLGALLDSTHLTHLAEPRLETHTLTSWEIVPNFPFHVHPIAKET